MLRQQERHGFALDLLHDGSSLPDILGRRALALPELCGTDDERTAARRAAVHVATAAGISQKVIGDLLASSVRTVQRLAAEDSPEDLVRAVCLQLRLRAGLARRRG